VITTFDVIHDAVDPAGVLRAVLTALRPAGRYVCVDIDCAERATDNTGPIATMLYAFSLSYCLAVSLGEGGTGLGTCGLAEPVRRRMATEAGFRNSAASGTSRIEDPFNTIYELACCMPSRFGSRGLRRRRRPVTGLPGHPQGFA
jgi:hypothetical protein